MAVLFWDAKDFGLKTDEVKAQYATVEQAIAQAVHDRARGRHPLRVENESGEVVWRAEV